MRPGTYVPRIGRDKLEAVSGREVYHIDGDPTNNNFDNLELRMTTQEERDRAVIARIGGHWYVSCIAHDGGPLFPLHDECVQAYGIDFANARRDRLSAPPQLSEAAFDWPIYRIAMLDAGMPGKYLLTDAVLTVYDPARIVGDGLHASWSWKR